MAEKKPLDKLIEEHNLYQSKITKNYVHRDSQVSYQLITTAHDVKTQEIVGVFCMNSMPRLKFVRPMKEFIEKFDEGHSAR